MLITPPPVLFSQFTSASGEDWLRRRGSAGQGELSIDQLEALIDKMPRYEYGNYLRSVADEWHRLKGENQ